MKPVIGFAGMTHLGLNSAVASAERGFEVICFDPDERRIAPLNRGELSIVEPELPEMFARNRDRLTFTTDTADLKKIDVCYIAPDVATNDQGESDLGPINRLIRQVDAGLRPDAVMVILSQVPPGFTRTLTRAKDKLFYQVETLIFGRAIERAMYPERFILGCAQPKQALPQAWQEYLAAFDCPLLPMRYESAELAKISINCCLVASVSVANSLAEICEKIGADWSEIVPALKLDKRIGPYSYLAPGLGIAGGNLERDLATVCQFADQYGTDAGVIRAWIKNSRHRKDWALRTVHQQVLRRVDNPLLGVLGLAYKQDTHSVKNSPSLALIEALSPYSIHCFDPAVRPMMDWHPDLRGMGDAISVMDGIDALIIMTPWGEFKNLDAVEIKKRMKGQIVIDPYAVLDWEKVRAQGLEYHTLGVVG